MDESIAIEIAFEKLIQRFRQYFQPIGITRSFTVTNAKPAGKAQVIIGTIGEGSTALPGQVMDIGNNDVFANGEVYELHGTGDPNDPQWRIGRRLVARNPKRGADNFASLPAPVMSAVVNPDDGFANPISLGTEADLNANTGAVAEPFALVRAFYRTIVPGSYSVFKPDFHIKSVQLQYKPVSADGWRNVPSQQITPARPIRITLNEDLTSSELSADIALPADVSLAELHPGYYVHWRIDGEIVIGKVVSAVLLTIMAGGRGLESTNAVAHTTGAQIELLTGQAAAHNLDPGVETQVRVAFVDGYGVDGPPSVVNVLTTWKRQTIPPLVDGDFSVDMRSNGIHLKWSRPIDTVSGLPITAKLFYKVYRNTSASTSGAKTVLEKFPGFEADISASLWDTDATRKDAVWFGIQVSDGFGNESAGTATNLINGVLWAKDNTAPPAPTGVTFQSVPNGVAVHVSPSIDTAHTDVGFFQFILYTNNAGTGTTGTEVTRSKDLDFIYEIYNLSSQTYYQLASADETGNVSALNTSNWQYVASLYPTNDWPINGNFADPDPGSPAPGTAGAKPNHWSVFTNGIPGGSNHRYLAAGGAEGNRVMAVDVSANAPFSGGILVLSEKQIMPSQKTPTLDMWLYVTQSLSGTQRFTTYCVVDGWAGEDGSSSQGAYFFTSALLTLTANTWTKVTVAMTPLIATLPAARLGQLSVGIAFPSGATNPAFTLYFDSVRILWV